MNNELILLLESKLELNKMPEDVVTNFLASMIRYLDHGRKDGGELKGRTLEFMDNKLNEFIYFYSCIGASKLEMVNVLTEFPTILNITSDLYPKYLFLVFTEDINNSVRKDKFINQPKGIMVSLEKMYKRFKLMNYCGYDNYSWSMLVNCSSTVFAERFVQKEKKYFYQKFDSVNQVNEFMDNTPFDFDIDSYKDIELNKDIVEKYEKREFRM